MHITWNRYYIYENWMVRGKKWAETLRKCRDMRARQISADRLKPIWLYVQFLCDIYFRLRCDERSHIIFMFCSFFLFNVVFTVRYRTSPEICRQRLYVYFFYLYYAFNNPKDCWFVFIFIFVAWNRMNSP